MIYAPGLEVATLVLGIIILLVEAFAERLDKRIFGYVGIVGLLAIFAATFFVAPQQPAIDPAPSRPEVGGRPQGSGVRSGRIGSTTAP